VGLVAGGLRLATFNDPEGVVQGFGYFLAFLAVFPAAMLGVEVRRRRSGRF